jgi:hypothetical protein
VSGRALAAELKAAPARLRAARSHALHPDRTAVRSRINHVTAPRVSRSTPVTGIGEAPLTAPARMCGCSTGCTRCICGVGRYKQSNSKTLQNLGHPKCNPQSEIKCVRMIARTNITDRTVFKNEKIERNRNDALYNFCSDSISIGHYRLQQQLSLSAPPFCFHPFFLCFS